MIPYLGILFFKICVKALPEESDLKLVKLSSACALEYP